MKIINGDEIKRVAREAFANDSEIGHTISLLIDELVDRAPALNVRQGFWVHQPTLIPYCSECGEYSDDAAARGAAYCHHCGAIMNLEIVGLLMTSNGIVSQNYGKWKRQDKNCAFPWLCSACGIYQCDRPIHHCPECKTDMELPYQMSAVMGRKDHS